MVQKIDHIGLAVKSIDQALPFYLNQLGLKALPAEEVPAQKVRVVRLPVGQIHVELLEPTAPDSPIAKFLEKRGEGIHHIAFEVADLQKELRELEADGICLVHTTPQTGSAGRKIAFLHPKSTSGSLIELTQI